VRVRQVDREVRIGFLVPDARGEREAQQPVRAEVVRVSYPPHSQPSVDPDAFRRRGAIVDSIEGDPLPSGEPLGAWDRRIGEFSGAPWGYTLRYGVRVRDRRGRSSPLVVAEDLVPVEPTAPPVELRAEATGDGIRLSWTAPTEGGSFRYNVYRNTTEPTPLDEPCNRKPLETPEYLDASAGLGETYTYRVRVALAENPPYRESGDSNSVTLLAEDRVAPSAPRGLVAVQEGVAVRLFWDPSPERDVRGYRVYRSRQGGEWRPIGPDPVERPLYLDPDVQIGEHLAYRVSAVDRAEPRNESPPSEPVSLVLLAEPTALEGGP
jgi:hypothetical protein